MSYELTSDALVREAVRSEKAQFFRYLHDSINLFDATKRIEVSSQKHKNMIKTAGGLAFFKDTAGIAEKYAGQGSTTAALLGSWQFALAMVVLGEVASKYDEQLENQYAMAKARLTANFTTIRQEFLAKLDQVEDEFMNTRAAISTIDQLTKFAQYQVTFSSDNLPESTIEERIKLYFGEMLERLGLFMDQFQTDKFVQQEFGSLIDKAEILFWASHQGGYKYDRVYVEARAGVKRPKKKDVSGSGYPIYEPLPKVQAWNWARMKHIKKAEQDRMLANISSFDVDLEPYNQISPSDHMGPGSVRSYKIAWIRPRQPGQKTRQNLVRKDQEIKIDYSALVRAHEDVSALLLKKYKYPVTIEYGPIVP